MLASQDAPPRTLQADVEVCALILAGHTGAKQGGDAAEVLAGQPQRVGCLAELCSSCGSRVRLPGLERGQLAQGLGFAEVNRITGAQNILIPYQARNGKRPQDEIC